MEDLHYSQGNILTNLLLSSEIRGFIQSPEYYFESQDLHHRKAPGFINDDSGMETI